MINFKNWKYFYLDKLFDIRAGNYYYSHEYDEGDTPYVSASNVNNGIQQRINLQADFDGNCIVTGKVGCTAFYQSEAFCATSDVNIFRAKNFEMNRQIGLFIVSIINFSENYKWNYGRQCRIGDSKKIKIKLPILMEDNEAVKDINNIYSDNGFIPDFDWIMKFMESVETRERESFSSIRDSITTNNNSISNESIDISHWRKFKLGDLFSEIYKSQAFVKGNMDLIDRGSSSINFISRTELNNGCDCTVLKEGLDGIENKNAVTIGDTTATIFYQSEEFVTGDHIVVCRGEWLNPYTGLFIKTIIEQERYKYSYGRAFKMDSIKNTEINLPITQEGNPDWEYMECFIKRLPYGDKLGYK